MARDSSGLKDVTLYIDVYKDGFNFTIDDEWYRTYMVYQHPKERESFVIEIDEGPEQYWYIWAKKFKYSDFGVLSLCGLLEKLKRKPDVTLYKILKRKYHVVEMEIDDNNGEIKIEGCDPNEPIKDLPDENIDWEKAEEDSEIRPWGIPFDPTSNEGEDILVIEKCDKCFRFYTKYDYQGRAWVYEQHPTDPNAYLISFEQYGQDVVTVVREYSARENLATIYRELVDDPQNAWWLSSDTIPTLNFKKVEIINRSKYPGYTFECCEPIDPEGLEEIKNSDIRSIPKEGQISIQYTRVSEDSDPKAPLIWDYDDVNKLRGLYKLIDIVKGEKVIEIGGGTGYLAYVIAHFAKHIDTFEDRPSYVAVFTKYILPHVIEKGLPLNYIIKKVSENDLKHLPKYDVGIYSGLADYKRILRMLKQISEKVVWITFCDIKKAKEGKIDPANARNLEICVFDEGDKELRQVLEGREEEEEDEEEEEE